MKRFAMAAAVFFGLVFSSALSAQGIQNIFHYRFLWPADLKNPGRNLIELKIKELGKNPQYATPLGNAELKSFDLIDASGAVVARAKVMKLSGRDDVLIFATEVLKAVPAATGKYENPAFALPAIRPDTRYKNVLDYKIEVYENAVLKKEQEMLKIEDLVPEIL